MAEISRRNNNNLYLHADGDSFFVSCELSVHPELKGLPVIVGADRGIAVAMSMEAKALGVTRGMPVFEIKKLFPEVIILTHHFDLYQDIAEKMCQILSSYFVAVEQYSIDECFALVDPSEIKYFGGEEKLMRELKKEIESTLGVTYSLGLARTKALSKLASKLEKPRGLVILRTEEDEIYALKSTPINDIWGIGHRTFPRLEKMGMKNAYDFVKFQDAFLSKNFSSSLINLKRELSGEQILEVESDHDPRDQKSIQSTRTFRPASNDPKVIWREIAENTESACKSARSILVVSNKISFFVKTSEFKYRFDEIKLPLFTSDPGIIMNEMEPRFMKLLKNREGIRSTGVILNNLTKIENIPLDLFGKQKGVLKKTDIEEVADIIRAKHGDHMIKRLSSVRKEAKERKK
ncbi:MAG: hypothetical protein ABIS26_02300 [Candidatus Paceibacterota bacterium]